MPMYGMRTPEGDDTYYQSPDWLREKMLRAGPDFWNSHSGSAGVEWGHHDLGLVFHERFGFAFAYHEEDEISKKLVGYVSWAKEEWGEPVPVCVGGGDEFIPEAEFVPRELAFEVVCDFCETGRRSSRINWVNSWDLHPGYNMATGELLRPSPKTLPRFAPKDERNLLMPAQAEINQIIVGTDSGWTLTIERDGAADLTLANWPDSGARVPAGTFDFAAVRDELLRTCQLPGNESSAWFVTFPRAGQYSFGSERIDESKAKNLFRRALQQVATKEAQFDERLRNFPPPI